MTSYLVVDGVEFLHHGDDVVYLIEEPQVNTSEGAEVLHGVRLTVVECSCDSKDTFVGGVSKLLSVGEERRKIILQYNYHHSTKLYWKISRVCFRLYCYKSAAQVTTPTATNE